MSLSITLWLGHPMVKAPTAQAVDARQLVQTGVDYYQAGNFLAAIDPWLQAQTAYQDTQDLEALAIVNENLARAYQQLGHTSTEIRYWEQAIATIQRLDNPIKLGRLLTEQAQAYGRLGQHRRGIAILCGALPDVDSCQQGSALEIAKTTSDTLGQVTALGSLGEAYRATGQNVIAMAYLKQGYEQVSGLDAAGLEAALLNSLGNTSTSLAVVSYRRLDEAIEGGFSTGNLKAEADENNRKAIRYFKESYDLASKNNAPEVQLQALLNLVPAYERASDIKAAQEQRQLALDLLPQLPDSKTKAFATIQLANFLDPLNIRQSPLGLNENKPTPADEAEAASLLNQALAIGKATDNFRIKSFALGRLGNLDERMERYDAALEKTQQASLEADQSMAAQDSLYLWEWQLGRIYEKQEKNNQASQAYSRAVSLLDQLRSDILGSNRDLQFDFRDAVEPLYRQYADLSLKTVPDKVILTEGENAFDNLEVALTTLDSLKVAELQSYFANDCVIVPAQTRADSVGQSEATAVFSTSIAKDRLSVIVSLPGGNEKIVGLEDVSAETVRQTITQFRIALESGNRDDVFDNQPAQTLYSWLIKPFEQDLAEVKTLVFVNDGLLRSVPMAALFDGEQYLIEKYAVATTPSLTLTTPEKVERGQLNALLLGVTEESNVPEGLFNPLPAVKQELAILSEKLPDSKVLVDQDFSTEAVRQSLAEKDYRVLHMATHGTFGVSPESNFVVLGAKQTGEDSNFNEKLTIGDLDRLLREINDPTRAPVELLTLSACETGIGDNRSTLGLAGVAVRAGVRSAIATLWVVDDESTAEVMATFYTNLQDSSLTKAEALQKAQRAMLESSDIRRQHPYRWAPFILIGNWL